MANVPVLSREWVRQVADECRDYLRRTAPQRAAEEERVRLSALAYEQKLLDELNEHERREFALVNSRFL